MLIVVTVPRATAHPPGRVGTDTEVLRLFTTTRAVLRSPPPTPA